MQRVGSALGIGWAPLPGPIGAGSVLVAALRDGSLALLDTCQVNSKCSRDSSSLSDSPGLAPTLRIAVSQARRPREFDPLPVMPGRS
jgi:hypothetical protein